MKPEKLKCEDCEYYDGDFNGNEVCTEDLFENQGCPKALPESRICDSFKPKERR